MATRTLPAEKLPPYDNEAEAATLGSLLIDGDALAAVGAFLEIGDFFSGKNAAVYQACQAVYNRGEAINQITVADELRRMDKLEEAGGASYLAELVYLVPTSLHAEYYARIVKRSSLMRRLIQTAGKIAAMGYEAPADINATLTKAEELLFQLRQAQPGRGFRPLQEIVGEYLEELVTPREASERGIQTGFGDLDNMLGSLRPADLVTVAGRPGSGKSSFLLNVAVAAAKRASKVGLFSLEMAAAELCQRVVASEANVDLTQVRLERMGEEFRQRVFEATGEVAELPIWIDDSAMLRVGDIRARAKRLASQSGLDLLMVDHVGLLKGNGKHENRVEEMGEITYALKALAKDLEIPVIIASQLSRAVESRSPHIPILSDLRSSGSIEQDSDIVMFIYREDYYTSEEEWVRLNPTKPYPKGIADIIVAKHRNGPTGQISLLWQERLTKFMPLEIYRTETERQPALM